jgi:xyloglucan-specific exo-beta-1,4-glucanase
VFSNRCSWRCAVLAVVALWVASCGGSGMRGDSAQGNGTLLAAASPTWRSVSIGGGGFITGLILHPKEKDVVYARVDVAGLFRWDEAAAAWKPLNDWMDETQKNDYGIESVAVDPQDANVVYMATGQYPFPAGKIYRSADRGDTWRLISPPGWNVEMGGGGEKRWAGERLVVSPTNRANTACGAPKTAVRTGSRPRSVRPRTTWACLR